MIQEGYTNRPAQILLVDDNPGDARLTREALESEDLRNELHWVEDGEAAMAFLRQEGEHADKPRPDLILLDLNLPLMDGREVLSAIKTSERLRSIPVVVMTTSSSVEDITHAYDTHANCYLTKPLDFMAFKETIRSLQLFWLQIARLPTGNGA